jgi:hypothetical protein
LCCARSFRTTLATYVVSSGSSRLLLLFAGIDGTSVVGDDDGFGDDLITVRGLSVDVVAILDTPDDEDNGGLQDDVGGQ